MLVMYLVIANLPIPFLRSISQLPECSGNVIGFELNVLSFEPKVNYKRN